MDDQAYFDVMERELEKIQDRAAVLAERLIKQKLESLHAKYPRHKFGFFDGQGTTFFTIDPPFLGEDTLNEIYFPWGLVSTDYTDIVNNMFDQLAEIEQIAQWLEEKFGMNVGKVSVEI